MKIVYIEHNIYNMNHNVIHKLIDVNMLSNNFIDIFSYEVVKTCAKILNESMLVIR